MKVMRPRISQAEAQFLLETLQTRKEEIQALVERKKQLDSEVYRLRQEAKLNSYVFIDKEKGFKDKKQQLQELEALSYRLFCLIGCYDSLINKFSVIASGQKRCGRYKIRATLQKWRMKEIEPKRV